MSIVPTELSFLKQAIETVNEEIQEEIIAMRERGVSDEGLSFILKAMNDLFDSSQKYGDYLIEEELTSKEVEDSEVEFPVFYTFDIGDFATIISPTWAYEPDLTLAKKLGHPDIELTDPCDFLKRRDIVQVLARGTDSDGDIVYVCIHGDKKFIIHEDGLKICPTSSSKLVTYKFEVGETVNLSGKLIFYFPSESLCSTLGFSMKDDFSMDFKTRGKGIVLARNEHPDKPGTPMYAVELADGKKYILLEKGIEKV